jgi:hypothetical protein
MRTTFLVETCQAIIITILVTILDPVVVILMTRVDPKEEVDSGQTTEAMGNNNKTVLVSVITSRPSNVSSSLRTVSVPMEQIALSHMEQLKSDI